MCTHESRRRDEVDELVVAVLVLRHVERVGVVHRQLVYKQQPHVYMYIQRHVYMYSHASTCAATRLYVQRHVYMYSDTSKCTATRPHIRRHVYMYNDMSTCTATRVHVQ